MTGKREIFFQPKVPFDSSQYELKQVFFKSKDGTQVPMFIAGKKGLKQDGSERLLMTGYGGFNLSDDARLESRLGLVAPAGRLVRDAQPARRRRVRRAMARAGHVRKKAERLRRLVRRSRVPDRTTSTLRPQHFAISGRSNGGLLMGASITQQPELFSAVWCGYPLLDMLRYQKFEQGPHWTTEYGSAENEKQFPYLLKYSPYQNVKAGTAYPAVMFFTGDSDTRVDPLHARKMTALLQAASKSGRPILLHYRRWQAAIRQG